MFDSLKDWGSSVAITLYRFIKTNAAGDKEFSDAEIIRCYPVGEITVVKNTFGDEVTSTAHFYVEPSYGLTVEDKVTFENADKEIISIVTHYDGNDGQPSICTVYI